MKEDIKSSLNFDPLQAAEDITGDPQNPLTDILAIRMAVDNSNRKDTLLKSIRDTTFSMGMKEYIANVLAFGFEIIYDKVFTGRDQEKERHCILFHHQYGVLLNVDSFQGHRNTAKAYFNFKAQKDRFKELRHVGLSGTHGGILESFDARESIRFKIQSMLQNGAFIQNWEEKPFLWLLNFSDDSDKYKSINQKMIESFPESVKNKIQPNIK